MSRDPFDPRHFDVAAFAAAGGTLAAQQPLAELPRLRAALAGGAGQSVGEAAWRVEGRQVARAGTPAEVWLQLWADAVVPLVCQRCLGIVHVPLAIDRSFRFVEDEQIAERLDAEVEEDVLVLSRRFDLLDLVEDELLLHLPLVPRHDDCRPPEDGAAEPQQRENPFAVLAALRGGKQGGE